MAQQDGGGLDIGLTGTVDVEHVIAVRVFNYGERPEYVMLTGLETLAGDPLVDDRPRAAKLVDDPPPELREVPSRGQLVTKFKVAASKVGEGFVGFAVLGTGARIYSVPAMPDTDIAGLQAQILKAVSEASSDDDV